MMKYQLNGADFMAYAANAIGTETIKSMQDLIEYFDKIKSYIPEGIRLILQDNEPLKLIEELDRLSLFVNNTIPKILARGPLTLDEYKAATYDFATQLLKTELNDAVIDAFYYAESVLDHADRKNQQVEWYLGIQTSPNGRKAYKDFLPENHNVDTNTLIEFPGICLYVKSVAPKMELLAP